MAAEYKFEDGYIRITLSGSSSSDDIESQAAEIARDPASRPNLNLLLDHRSSTVVAGSDDIRERVEYLASIREHLGPRVAVLVSTTVHYGLARMANLLGDSRKLNIEVFKDEREAIDWLNSGSAGDRDT
jgi:hypothetical protein